MQEQQLKQKQGQGKLQIHAGAPRSSAGPHPFPSQGPHTPSTQSKPRPIGLILR